MRFTFPITFMLMATFVGIVPANADEKKSSESATEVRKADFSDPLKTYRTYLEAVKGNDLNLAKECMFLKKDAPGVLDFAVGLWIAHHRFNALVTTRFGKHDDSPFFRSDCNDEAIDRTLDKLANATVIIKGDSAEMTINWGDYDDAHPVFNFQGDAPMIFSKIKGLWKIACDLEEPAEKLFAPGTWGWCFRESMKALNETSDAIESGKLKNWEQVNARMEERQKELERQYQKDYQPPGSAPE